MFLPNAPAKDFSLYSFPRTLVVPPMSYASNFRMIPKVYFLEVCPPKDCNVSLILTLSTYIPISQLEDREW
jgi:hypothetical protein